MLVCAYSLSSNIRLFAELNVALADAGIAVWDAKYTYGLWRPIDAIQDANLDPNPATMADPNWTAIVDYSFVSGVDLGPFNVQHGGRPDPRGNIW